MINTNPDVDFFFQKSKDWKALLEQLRGLAIGCGLDEVLKWGCPCYTDAGRNIVLIHAFKEYCALLFFKGALLDDADGLLVQQTGNVQAARQIRFTAAGEVEEWKAVVEKNIRQAVEIERAGLKVTLKKNTEFQMPEEFRAALEADAGLQSAFQALTPGRQRGYLLHFSQAKQAATRLSRIEKATPQILAGKGLND